MTPRTFETTKIEAFIKELGEEELHYLNRLIKEYFEIAREILHGFDYGKYRTKATELLLPAANHILGLEDGKKRWADAVLGMTEAFSLCGTLDEALPIREELAFFQAVKAVIAKAGSPENRSSEKAKESVLRQILDNAVVVQGIQDIFSLAGMERPDISILSDDFLSEVRSLPYRNLAIELLNRLMSDQIASRAKSNVILEKKFADRLRETINRYHNRAIESAQVIEELIAMAKEFRGSGGQGREAGPQRRRIRLLRGPGEQRERDARARRRDTQGHRQGTDRKITRKRERRLAKTRERSRAASQSRAHNAQTL
jgi:type I site-specific restriction-modification system R (restriction) subunit